MADKLQRDLMKCFVVVLCLREGQVQRDGRQVAARPDEVFCVQEKAKFNAMADKLQRDLMEYFVVVLCLREGQVQRDGRQVAARPDGVFCCCFVFRRRPSSTRWPTSCSET